jgi:hypothetical protein
MTVSQGSGLVYSVDILFCHLFVFILWLYLNYDYKLGRNSFSFHISYVCSSSSRYDIWQDAAATSHSVWDKYRLVRIYKMSNEKLTTTKRQMYMSPLRQPRHIRSSSFIISPCKTRQRQESFFSRTISDRKRQQYPIVMNRSV